MSRFRKRRGSSAAPPASHRPGHLPWQPRDSDVGMRIVDEIGHSLSLNEEWSVRDERGFSWWGKDLAQRVWAEPVSMTPASRSFVYTRGPTC